MWEWWKRGGEHQLYRPCVFHRVGIPGSGGKDWFRSDWEYVMCFKRPGALPWADNTACGHPPKWAPGGEMSYRVSDGTRRNQWGSKTSGQAERNADGKLTKRSRPSHRQHTKRKSDGSVEEQGYTVPAKANPGNVADRTYSTAELTELLSAYESSSVQRLNVGGGLMGDEICHENEAPFPERLAEFFVRSCCPEGGWCLDPFSGSGTTAAVCQQWGRNCIGVDLRESQTELGRRRTSQRLLV